DGEMFKSINNWMMGYLAGIQESGRGLCKMHFGPDSVWVLLLIHLFVFMINKILLSPSYFNGSSGVQTRSFSVVKIVSDIDVWLMELQNLIQILGDEDDKAHQPVYKYSLTSQF
ncbi:hypothetical protein ACJX0J_036014, partial [Zea mays]